MSEPSAQYHIYSKLPNDPLVGVLPVEGEQQSLQFRQPIRVGDYILNQWEAIPPLVGGVHLNPMFYKYSEELEGVVYGTNDPGADRKWFLRPLNEQDTYLIGMDEETSSVWTVVENTVKIEPLKPGDWSQVFKVVPSNA